MTMLICFLKGQFATWKKFVTLVDGILITFLCCHFHLISSCIIINKALINWKFFLNLGDAEPQL